MTYRFGFNRQKYKNRRAFSLAELMIATGILGVGMIIVAMAFPVALDQSRQAAELATSKLVYLDAVNKLKTQIKWTELEQYINPNDAAATDGAQEENPATHAPIYRLGGNETVALPGPRIYLLDFGLDNPLHRVPLDPDGTNSSNLFTNLDNDNCVYSADETYGWIAAVQKISNQNYKFWIFVIREPRGIDSVTNLQLSIILNANINNMSGKKIKFNSLSVAPSRGEVLLDDTGTLFTVTDVGEPNTSDSNRVTVMLDKEIDTTATRYLTHVTGTGFTRKNPVLSVYQTVISY